MRITIDIEEETLEDAMKITGIKKKGPAIAKAAEEYIRRTKVREFGRMMMEGEFEDYPMTNEEIESSDR